MEEFFLIEELRTVRAWNLLRKITKAEYEYFQARRQEKASTLISLHMRQQIGLLYDALWKDYDVTSLLLTIEHPDLQRQSVVETAYKVHRQQMQAALVMSKQRSESENYDPASA